jgi:hypothetical protein
MLIAGHVLAPLILGSLPVFPACLILDHVFFRLQAATERILEALDLLSRRLLRPLARLLDRIYGPGTTP